MTVFITVPSNFMLLWWSFKKVVLVFTVGGDGGLSSPGISFRLVPTLTVIHQAHAILR
jgi:hypothetical protein